MTCGHPMDSYYGHYCPLCSEIKAEKPVPVYNFFRTATQIAAKEGYTWQDNESWVHRVFENIHHNVQNDTYYPFDLCIDEDDDTEVNQYKRGLRKYTGLPEDAYIILWVSW